MSETHRTTHGHQSAEAFCLMWYACKCGHQERLWNSRDGVTPFATACPSCGGTWGERGLTHVRWREDEYAPDHKPHHGQRVWIDMTRERAEHYARARIEQARKAGHELDAERFEPLVRNIMGEHGGAAPDMVLIGYIA